MGWNSDRINRNASASRFVLSPTFVLFRGTQFPCTIDFSDLDRLPYQFQRDATSQKRASHRLACSMTWTFPSKSIDKLKQVLPLAATSQARS
jgi:hypothetical protein